MSSADTPSSTSLSLLEQVRKLEPQGWERFVRLYGPLVYEWGRIARLQDEDAADVMQEVFRSVAAKIALFRHDQPEDSFRGWLWTITNNKIRDHFRQREARPDARGGSDWQIQLQQLQFDEAPSPAGSTADSDGDALARLYQRALNLTEAEFPPHQWQAFLLVTVHEQPPADVATKLGISVWSVYQAKSRVLRRLRQQLSCIADA